MSTKSGKKVRKRTVAIFISGVAAVTAWILIATLFFDAPLRLIIATQQDGYQYEEYQESGYPQYPSYTDNDGHGYGETDNEEANDNDYYGETGNEEANDNDYYGETDNDDYGYGDNDNDYGGTDNDNDYGETGNEEANDNDYYGETNNEEANDNDYYGEASNDDANDCTCECYDDCDEDCDCECDDCNEDDLKLPPGGNTPDLDIHGLDAMIDYLNSQVSYYQMQLLLLNNRLFELNIQLIAARGASNQATIDALELEIAYITAQIDELDEHLGQLEARLAYYMYLRDGVIIQQPCPGIETPIQQLLSQIQELTIYIDTLATRFAQLSEARDTTDCGHEGEYLDTQMHALRQQSYNLIAQVETLAQQVQDFIQPQQRARSFSAAESEIEQLQLNSLDTDMYELEYSLSYYLALLEGIFGIMPFAAGPSMYTPDSILSMGLPPANFAEVNSDATLRGALTNAGANPLIIRVTGNFNITGTGVIATSGGATDREIHIYSYSPGSHIITRTAGSTRHFDITRNVHLHLYNVTLTQTGPTGATDHRGGVSVSGTGAQLHMYADSTIRNNRALDGGGVLVGGANAQLHMHTGSHIYNNRATQSTTTDRRGGGVAMTGGAGTRLIMHPGSTISYNQVAGTSTSGDGRGGGVFMTNGIVTMHPGSAISHNQVANTGTGSGGLRRGGGVAMSAGQFIMHGGSITNNTIVGINAGGGGVHMAAGTFTMHGGSRISHNIYTDGGRVSGYQSAGGGGVMINGGHFTMNAGSEVSHNRAEGRGGGFRSLSGATITLNEDALVYRNVSNHDSAGGGADWSGGGGGLSIGNGSTLHVNNAIINHNQALRSHGGGIQLAAGTGTGRAVLNINSVRLTNNTAGSNGGGIHSNGHSTLTIAGVSIIEGNRATNGGAMRIFSGSSQNFTFGAGSRIINNIATENGAGISIGHTGTGNTDSNANTIGLRINGTAANPVIFEGNRAIGTGGAIHHEGPNITDANRGIHITHARFINNRASDGGAISLALNRNDPNTGTQVRNTNLLTNAPTTALHITNTTFEGNTATNGLLVDENLAAWNVGRANFADGEVGSVTWIGPRTNTAGVVQEVGVRNHIWNNYDVITRNQLAARIVNFEIISDTGAEIISDMEAELTETRRSTNHTTSTVGVATTDTTSHSMPRDLLDGDTVIRNSLTAFEVIQHPWNAAIIYWVNYQITRTWVGDPVTGSMVETYVRTVIPNSANTLEQTNVNVDQHTLIQVRIDYIYHPVTFTVYPAATLGRLNGSAGNVTNVERQLRQSRSAADHVGYTGVTPRGNPIGAPPVTVENAPWRFVEWRLGSSTGPVVTEAEIAAMYVSGPLNFVAIFSDMWLVTFDPDGGTFPQGGGVYCDDPVVQEVIAGSQASPPNPPPVKENYFFVGWYYDDDGDLIEWNFTTQIDRDITLIAVWTPAITDVTVAKRVSGSMADFGRYFSFTITLTCEDDLPLPSTTEIFYAISCGDASTCSIGCQCDFRQGLLGNPPTPREVDLQNGTFQFWLRHMQSITFYGVPANAQILVVEGDYPLYITWIYVDGNTASQVNGNSFGPHVVVDALDGLHLQFNNDRGTIVQAGVIVGNTGITFIFFGAVLAAALIAFVIISRRKKESL